MGFGAHYDERLLRAMSDAGGGNAHYIERADQAGGIFEEELEGLLTLCAQNVSVRIAPGADAQFVHVQHDYPVEEQEAAVVFQLGDLYAREPRLLLAEFLVGPGGGAEEGDVSDAPGAVSEGAGQVEAEGSSKDAPAGEMPEPSALDVATLLVTAHVLTEDGGVELREITLPISLTPEEGGRVDPEVRKEILLLEAASAREEALRARESGDFTGASQSLMSAARSLAASGEDDADLREEAGDLRAMSALFESEAVTEADAKYLYQRSYGSRTSRKSGSKKIFRRDEDED